MIHRQVHLFRCPAGRSGARLSGHRLGRGDEAAAGPVPQHHARLRLNSSNLFLKIVNYRYRTKLNKLVLIFMYYLRFWCICHGYFRWKWNSVNVSMRQCVNASMRQCVNASTDDYFESPIFFSLVVHAVLFLSFWSLFQIEEDFMKPFVVMCFSNLLYISGIEQG